MAWKPGRAVPALPRRKGSFAFAFGPREVFFGLTNLLRRLFFFFYYWYLTTLGNRLFEVSMQSGPRGVRNADRRSPAKSGRFCLFVKTSGADGWSRLRQTGRSHSR